jgi:excinuclease ABC subunit A
VDLGNTVLVIEHHLDVIKQADWVIDLGPEGGEAGGRVVAQGTPEQVARNKKSYTGQGLARMLNAAGNSAHPQPEKTVAPETAIPRAAGDSR